MAEGLESGSTSELKEMNRLLRNLTSRRMTFMRGVYGGLGATLGVAVILAIIAWVMTQLEYLPYIGLVVKPINEAIKEVVPNGKL